ncbi:MAG: DedA family protein, partial [Planctomycetota bacterium]
TITIFLCRLVPGIRSLISIPAGINRMPLIPFIVYSTAGMAIWASLLGIAGYVLGENYEIVESYVGPWSKIILGILAVAAIAWITWRIWHVRKAEQHRQPESAGATDDDGAPDAMPQNSSTTTGSDGSSSSDGNSDTGTPPPVAVADRESL